MYHQDKKFSLKEMMAADRRAVSYAVSHSRYISSRASQSARAAEAEKPLPSYIPRDDRRGQSNTGRVWSF